MFAAKDSLLTRPSGGGYQISRSLRFNEADTAYLTRTPASASNRKTWTWSAWIKRGKIDRYERYTLFASRPTANPYTLFYFSGGAQPNQYGLRFEDPSADLQTTQVFRDMSAWYHFVLAVDTTQATASNRIKMYVNGSQITVFTAATYPTQNTDMSINNTTEQCIGSNTYLASTEDFDGYMTEINFVDGTQLTPSSFGETNAQTGVWQPKAYSGSYGTNGFYVNFSDNSATTAATLGKDYSGNGNNWTPNNFSVTAGADNDSLVDSPTSYGTDTGAGGSVRGNYATLNPLFVPLAGINYFALSNGNLNITGTSSADSGDSIGTISTGISGKYYFEVNITSIDSTGYGIVGASDINQTVSASVYNYLGYLTKSYGYNSSGVKTNNNTNPAYGSSYTNGDVIGVAIDCDNGAIYFSKNNTWQTSGVPTSGSSRTGAAFTWTGGSQDMVPQMAVYKTGTTLSDNFGQRPFIYSAPTSFKALCTQNLPTPTIGATTATQAGKFFNAVTYTGTGSSLGVTGVGFQPDWVWVKGRSGATDHGLYDAVRGVQKQLESNTTTAETTETTGITAFGSDGFTTGALAQLNTSSATYVAWNWKANGAGSSNTSGSITSTVSASTTSGFSVVTYTGTSGTQTIGHGLGAVPSMIISKSRSAAEGWWTYHISLGYTQYLALNSTNAAIAGSWGGAPTSTVFYNTGGQFMTSGQTYVAYCFAPIAGYSAFGSYTGNGSSTDGTFVYTGFLPRYVLIKRTTSAYDWWILDSARGTINVVKGRLYANDSAAESSTYGYVDFVSNGFKLREGDGGINGSGQPYIYMAFASVPFKYSLAR